MTGGGKIVGLGPRRDEASLSSTALSVRKTRHWGSIHSVPLPPCSVQGCCLSGSPSQPRTRCSVVVAALLPAPSAGPPHASPAHPQPKVLQGAERIASRADRRRSQLRPFLRIAAKVARPRLAATVAGPFPPADSFCLFHSKLKVTEHATELRVHRSLTPGPPRYVKLILLPGLLGILFCFMTAGYQQVTGAKERLLHRKSTSDPCSSLPPIS